MVLQVLRLLLYYSRPRVERYKSLRALNTSPPWKCFSLLRSNCSLIDKHGHALEESLFTPPGPLLNEHIIQSRPDSGFDLQTNVLEMFELFGIAQTLRAPAVIQWGNPYIAYP